MTKTVWFTKALGAIVVFPIVAVALSAIAHAGPQDYGDPETVISSLEEQGNYVMLNRTGTWPLEDCVVTGVRQGTSVYREEHPVGAHRKSVQKTLDHGTYYVDLKC
ncbi:hypothetical protein [Mycobacteroides salmoniphilum]|uniref:hypothetical protein n=1 Tax=Mycobacteroides salmoniphilum TaxID=404941 RepID=UPI000992ADB4|nr:hypothetical protein [Mycobacteroides salmoniphilum]QCH22881.1 hypothetical protein DSM43276_01127 [Mycobacteroides salmoniphilum]